MRVSALAIGIAFLSMQAKAEDHWAYVPPMDSKDSSIDALLDTAWKKAGLAPANMAPPRQ